MTNKKVRGAVSVFLVMILVPCIVVTSVFVDLGRVHMSKSMANAAADLALNSLLTNYDADLNEWYGMIASCQNIDEFYEASAQYFLRTISSQGLSKDEIILLSDYYANATNDDSIFDLLQAESQTAPSEMIKAVDGANLANAALIKDQVIEFMKYRAPIEISTDLISRFRNADGTPTEIASYILENDQNAELVENKQEYYEAEGELLTAAFNSYVAIYDYYSASRSIGLNNAKMIEYMNKINGYKSAYSDIHSKTVSNLFNTAGLSKYSRVTYSLTAYNSTYTEKHNSVYTKKENKDGSTHYYIDETRIDSLLSKLEQEINKFETSITNYSNAASSCMSNMYGTGTNQPNAIQWWVKMNNAVNSSSNSQHSKVNDAAKNMLIAYSKVLAIKKCELIAGEDGNETWEEKYDTLTSKAESLQKKYLVSGKVDSNNAYLKAVNALEKVSSDNLNYIKSSSISISVDGQTKTIDEAIPYIATELSNLRQMMQDRVDELNTAIDGDGKDVKSLDDLKALAKKYNSTFSDWKSTANENNTQMKKFDKQSIDGTLTGTDAAANVDRAAKEITEASVTELKNRLVNIRDQLTTLINAIDSIKYGGTKVVGIKDFNTFKTKTGSKVSASNIPLKNGELSSYANNMFSQLFLPSGTSIVALNNTTSNNYNPDIDPSEGNSVNTPQLFVYFHKQWNGKSKSQFDEAKQDEENAKNAQDEYVENEKAKASEYRGGGTNIARDFSSGNSFSAGLGMLNSVTELVKAIIGGDFASIRDDIYSTTYMTHMFSYATYDREGMYSLLSEEDKKALNTGNFSTYYDKVKGDANTEQTWLSENLKDNYNKSLTNKMINANNNAAYLAELEYILYGKDTNEENIKSAFGEIYLFRFTLNSVSAFQHFWTPKNPTGQAITFVASAISAAFCGVIPAPVIKAVLLPILAAVETCKDNSRLSAGMPVELYKTEASDWWISIPSDSKSFSAFFSALSSGGDVKNNEDKGLFYSDYLTFFVYIGLSDGGDIEKDMYQRMAEIIQSNIRKHNGVPSDYTLKKSLVYFELNATIRVKPLMITIPFFNDESYKNNMKTKTDWCTYNIRTVRGYK